MSSIQSMPSARVLFVLACASFASATALRISDPLLPELVRVYSTSLSDAARIISYYSVSYGLMQFVLGMLSERFGKFRIVISAALISSLISLLCAMAVSLDMLVAARVVAGAAAAGIIPMTLAWLGDRVPYEKRQVTLARLAIGTTLGLASGQLLGGIFVDTVGWRGAFVALSAFYLWVGLSLVRQGRMQTPDVRGSESGFFARLAAAMSSWWSIVVYLLSMAESAAVFGMIALTPSYLHGELGLSLAASGGVVALFGLGALSFALLARRLVPVFGEVGLMAGGGALIAVCLIALAYAPSGLIAAAICALAGFGFYMMHNTLQTNATQLAPEVRGTAIAVFATLVFFGQAGGVAAGAWMVEHIGPRSYLFVSAAVLVACGLIFMVAHPRRPR